MSWSRFIGSAAAAEHGVQVYDSLDELVEPVVAYLAAGFESGSPAVVIATQEHWRAIDDALAARGCRADGLLTVLDAHDTLGALVGENGVSAAAFDEHVGAVVDAVAERHPGTTIRAFGEMVDVLWQRGDRADALALEELWNDLQRTRPFALLCAYCVDVFDPEVQAGGLADVFHAHTHARPVADTARLSAAVDQALVEVIGHAGAARVYLDVADGVPPGHLPRSQVVLGWLCKHRASTADAVLARARALYAA